MRTLPPVIGSLPPALLAELRALRDELPAASARRILRQAHAAAALIGWCRRALASSHVVHVALALTKSLGAHADDLATLRIPVDLLRRFPKWRQGSCAGFTPGDSRFRIAPAAAARRIHALRLQVAPDSGSLPVLLPLLRALATSLDSRTGIVVAIAPGRDREAVRRLASGILPTGRRARFFVGGAATPFARDHAVAGFGPRAEPTLLVPRAFLPERGREEVPIDAASVRRALGVRVVKSALYWQGGNVLFDGYRCLVGADLIRENVARLGLAAGEVVAILEAEFGSEVAVLGQLSRSSFDPVQDRVRRSGQASYHIDLDVCLLGPVDGRRPTALLSDPDLGLALLPRVLRSPVVRDAHGLPAVAARRMQAAHYRRVARERRPKLDQYARQLKRLGYRVVRVPELRVRRNRHEAGLHNLDISYCNALPGLHRGAPALYYMPWGIPAIDRAAARQMRAAGVTPVAVSTFAPLAHGMMELAAGLRCFCGSLP